MSKIEPSPDVHSASRWRSIASAIILVHIFCVVIAVSSNLGGQASPVGRALRRVPVVVPYLQFLGMDLAYEFSFASSSPQEASHRLVLARQAAPNDPLAFLPDATMSGPAARRYEQLAAYAADFDASFAENPDLATRLPVAIGEAWLADLGLPHDSYQIRGERTIPQRLVELPNREPPASKDVTPFVVSLIWSPADQIYQAVRRQSDELTARSLLDASDPIEEASREDAAATPPRSTPRDES